MINPYKNSGLAKANNFRNRYLDQEQLQKPSQAVADQIHKKAKSKIDEIIGVKTQAAHGTYLNNLRGDQSEVVRFTSKATNQEDTKQRIVKIQNVQVDPLLPPKYKHRKVPRGPASPPPQMLRSPPKQLSQKDVEDWKVPPCISNWRNPNGYTIPLHMRLSADGRTLQHNTINQHFADIIDSIYIAQRQARSELQQRARIQKSVNYKQYLKKQEQLRSAAIKAREQRNKLQEEGSRDEQQEMGIRQRAEIRSIRARQLEREQRLKTVGAKNKKAIRQAERDISQKVALGQAQPTNTQQLYDERLFNNSSGLGTGNLHQDDDNVYDKPLFTDRSALNKQVRATPDQGDDDGSTLNRNMRSEPVKFEKHKDEVFGLDSFVKKVKRG